MKRNKNNCDLQSCSLCRGCLREWLPAIDANRKTFDFKKGELLFTEGDVVSGIYFLISGSAKIHKSWGADKELIIRIAGAGDIVGHRGLGNETIYPISATTLAPATACFVDLPFFIASLKVNHEFAYKLLMFYAEELQESEKNMRNLAHMQVKPRMAYALLKLINRFGLDEHGVLKIDISRQDIASFVGTTYETAFRILNEMARDNLIHLSGKNIGIVDRGELVNYVREVEPNA